MHATQMRAMEDEIEADRERLTQLDSDLAENRAIMPRPLSHNLTTRIKLQAELLSRL